MKKINSWSLKTKMYLSLVIMVLMLPIHIGIAVGIAMMIPHFIWLPILIGAYVLVPSFTLFLYLLDFQRIFNKQNPGAEVRAILILNAASLLGAIYVLAYCGIYEPFLKLDDKLEAMQE